jgi:hypothetical protein
MVISSRFFANVGKIVLAGSFALQAAECDGLACA